MHLGFTPTTTSACCGAGQVLSLRAALSPGTILISPPLIPAIAIPAVPFSRCLALASSIPRSTSTPCPHPTTHSARQLGAALHDAPLPTVQQAPHAEWALQARRPVSQCRLYPQSLGCRSRSSGLLETSDFDSEISRASPALCSSLTGRCQTVLNEHFVIGTD